MYLLWGLIILAIPVAGILLSVLLPNPSLPSWTKIDFEFYLWWEVVALGAHMVLSIIWYFAIFWVKNKIAPCIGDSWKGWAGTVLLLMVLFVLAALVAASAPAWPLGWISDNWVVLHAGLLVIGAILVLLTNFIVVCGGDLSKNDCKGSYRRTYIFECRVSRESIYLIDIPTVMAFMALFALVYFWLSKGKPLNEEELKPFIAGAVAFQVMMANAAFFGVRIRHECRQLRRRSRSENNSRACGGSSAA